MWEHPSSFPHMRAHALTCALTPTGPATRSRGLTVISHDTWPRRCDTKAQVDVGLNTNRP